MFCTSSQAVFKTEAGFVPSDWVKVQVWLRDLNYTMLTTLVRHPQALHFLFIKLLSVSVRPSSVRTFQQASRWLNLNPARIQTVSRFSLERWIKISKDSRYVFPLDNWVTEHILYVFATQHWRLFSLSFPSTLPPSIPFLLLNTAPSQPMESQTTAGRQWSFCKYHGYILHGRECVPQSFYSPEVN